MSIRRGTGIRDKVMVEGAAGVAKLGRKRARPPAR